MERDLLVKGEARREKRRRPDSGDTGERSAAECMLRHGRQHRSPLAACVSDPAAAAAHMRWATGGGRVGGGTARVSR